MKYTIEGFDQQALVNLNFDLADVMILRWFTDFASSGRMKKIAIERELFYLVKYQGILDDLPILGITSIRGITKRFEKYIEKGIFIKQHRRAGAGTEVYYKPTDKLIKLQYNKGFNEIESTDQNCGSYQNKTKIPFIRELDFSFDQNCGSYQAESDNTTDRNCGSYHLDSRTRN